MWDYPRNKMSQEVFNSKELMPAGSAQPRLQSDLLATVEEACSASDKMPDKTQLKKGKVCFGSRFKGIMVEMIWLAAEA